MAASVAAYAAAKEHLRKRSIISNVEVQQANQKEYDDFERSQIVKAWRSNRSTLFLANIADGNALDFVEDFDSAKKGAEEKKEGDGVMVAWDNYEDALPAMRPPFMSEKHYDALRTHFKLHFAWVDAYLRIQPPPGDPRLLKKSVPKPSELDLLFGDDSKSDDTKHKIEHHGLPDAPESILRYNFMIFFFQAICGSNWFNALVVLCIVVAGILVGIQSYPSMQGNPGIEAVDFLVQVIFTIECVFKIIAEGRFPLRYWTGPELAWNNFDFWLVFVCWIPMGGNVGFLRLLRLMRLLKLVGKVKQLQLIVMGLIQGLKAVSYIAILMVLILYLFAVMGVTSFRENDPYHFGSLGVAMLTLFRCATLEDWSDVMYINMFGCDSQYGGVYGSYVGADGGDPSIPGNLGSMNVMISTDMGRFPAYECWNPTPQPFLSSMFFTAYLLIAAFVTIPLFVGAVCGGMHEAHIEFKEQAEEDARAEDRRQKLAKMIEEQKAASESGHDEVALRRAFEHFDTDQSGEVDEDELVEILEFLGEEDATLEQAHDMIAKVDNDGSGTLNFAEFFLMMTASDAEANEERERLEQRAREIEKEEEAQAWALMKKLRKAFQGKTVPRYDFDAMPLGLWRSYLKLSVYALKLSKEPWFVNSITCTILLAGAVVGIQTEMAVPGEMKTLPALEALDSAILVVFTIEIAVKLVGEGDKPLQYFTDAWNVFDFFIVFACYVFMLPFMPSVGSMLAMLRLLRLLRVLKLVRALPQLYIIISALFHGINSIFFVIVILFIFFYLCAIIGMMVFKENDPMHFGSLQMALISLFRAATGDDWTDIMYINILGCDNWGYEFGRGYLGFGEKGRVKEDHVSCTHPKRSGWLSAAFMVIFLLLGSMVLLNLFVGIVMISMAEATEENKETQEKEERVTKICKQLGIEEAAHAQLYRDIFEDLDTSHNGELEPEELKPLMRCLPFFGLGLMDDSGRAPPAARADSCVMTKMDLDVVIMAADSEFDGLIEFSEFLAIMEFFKRLDQDEWILTALRKAYRNEVKGDVPNDPSLENKTEQDLEAIAMKQESELRELERELEEMKKSSTEPTTYKEDASPKIFIRRASQASLKSNDSCHDSSSSPERSPRSPLPTAVPPPVVLEDLGDMGSLESSSVSGSFDGGSLEWVKHEGGGPPSGEEDDSSSASTGPSRQSPPPGKATVQFSEL